MYVHDLSFIINLLLIFNKKLLWLFLSVCPFWLVLFYNLHFSLVDALVIFKNFIMSYDKFI